MFFFQFISSLFLFGSALDFIASYRAHIDTLTDTICRTTDTILYNFRSRWSSRHVFLMFLLPCVKCPYNFCEVVVVVVVVVATVAAVV